MTGFRLLEIQWKKFFLATRPVCSEPINQRLQEVVKIEFDRLCVHTYRESTTPWASPVVTASNGTASFVKFNHYTIVPEVYILEV